MNNYENLFHPIISPRLYPTSSWVALQVPKIYEEMESAGCTPDRKARKMLQVAEAVLQQRHY